MERATAKMCFRAIFAFVAIGLLLLGFHLRSKAEIKLEVENAEIHRLARGSDNNQTDEGATEPNIADKFVDAFKRNSCGAIVSIGFRVFLSRNPNTREYRSLLDVCQAQENITAIAVWFTHKQEFWKQFIKQANKTTMNNVTVNTTAQNTFHHQSHTDATAFGNLNSTLDWDASFKSTNKMPAKKNVTTVTLALKLPQLVFTRELLDRRSDIYKNLSTECTSLMQRALVEEPGFLSVEVLGFSEGSVVTIYDVKFELPATEQEIFSDIKEAVTKSQAKNLRNESLERLRVDTHAMTRIPQDAARELRMAFEKTAVSIPKNVTKPTTFDSREESNNLENRTTSIFEISNEESGESPDNFNVSLDYKLYLQVCIKNMEFSADLIYPNSTMYKQLSDNLTQVVSSLNVEKDGLVEVIGYTKGSVIANLRIVYEAVEVHNEIKAKLERKILESGSLFALHGLTIDIKKTKLFGASSIEPCSLLTCPLNSHCNSISGVIKCVCPPGYVKIKPYECASVCDIRKDFCKNGGICVIETGRGPTCRCQTAYKWAVVDAYCEYADHHDMVLLGATAVLLCLGGVLCSAVVCYWCIINKGRKKWLATEKQRRGSEKQHLCNRHSPTQWHNASTYQAYGMTHHEMRMKTPEVCRSQINHRIVLPGDQRHGDGKPMAVNLQRAVTWHGIPRPDYDTRPTHP